IPDRGGKRHRPPRGEPRVEARVATQGDPGRRSSRVSHLGPRRSGDRWAFWDTELRGFIRDRVPDTYYLFPDDFESQERSNDCHDPPTELPPLPGVLPQDGERGRARPLRYRPVLEATRVDRKSTRLNSSHQIISYAVFCLKK